MIRLRALLLGGCAALLCGPLHAQNELRVTAEVVRAASIVVLRDGKYQQALELAETLLMRDGNDVPALLVASQAALALENPSLAARYARRAYWAAKTDVDSFSAARLAANSLASDGKDTRSQIWLRRARQYAPDQASSDAIARDFQTLRRRNPWNTSLNFAITPSSNINNGTLNQTAQLLGLPFTFDLSTDAQPLSGLQISGGFNTRYRIFANNASALFFDIDAFGRTYALSPSSKEAAPDVSGSDYSDASAGIGLTYRTVLQDGWQPTQVGFRLGQSWYSGDPYSETMDITFAQPIKLSDQDRLTFSASSQVRENEDNDPWVRTRRVSTSWDRKLANNDSLGLSFSLTEAQSNDIESDYDGYSVGVSYGLNTSFEGVALSGALSFDRKDYGANVHQVAIDRVDDTLRLRLFARLTEVEYYGFQPVITFDARQTSSNVTFYDDRNTYNFGFDLRSSF